MRYMNDFDIQMAQRSYNTSATPNRVRVARVVGRLAEWADDNSDGWAYWPKPARAAAKAMDLIDGGTYAEIEARHHEDATDAEVKAALTPIKSFLTRHGVSSETRDALLA